MLKRLTLDNIAIIDSLTIDFGPGLTVITGETGSGKSILMDALGWAFGQRLSPKEVLRTGAPRGRIEATFAIAPDALAAQDLDPDPEALISRELTATSSRQRVNGTPVPKETLEALRAPLLEIHGQHELSNLFDKSYHKDCLDSFGGLWALRAEVAMAHQAWKTLVDTREARIHAFQEGLRQRDYLTFQLEELTAAELARPDEDDTLKEEIQVLTYAADLVKSARQATGLLSEATPEAPSVLSLLHQAEKALGKTADFDPQLALLLDQLSAATGVVRELAGALDHYADTVSVDPARMDTLETRLELLEKLKRKYGPTLQAVIDTRDTVAQTLADLDVGEQELSDLDTAIATAQTTLQAHCDALTQARQTAAHTLTQALSERLHQLALPAARLSVTLTPLDGFSPSGHEHVEFLFSANPGEPLRPLGKVASGGELSRFLLALKVLVSGGVSTLVFDEIDTGISGQAVKAVAEHLVALSRTVQVVVITHQPVVAAMADQHLNVSKQILSDRVQVQVELLENKEKRLNVLSRLASGIDTDDEAVEKFIDRLLHTADAWKEAAAALQ
jgi:DNA repair protein RecN (Recombination protein N)